jgi:hypothetical protein
VVSLESDDSYAGVLERADTCVRQGERDIILGEPARYSEEKANYIALPYQYLFIPGTMVGSIAVVHDPDLDTRLSSVGCPLFLEPAADSEEDSV